MGDGQTERMNRTIIGMLKTLEEKEKLYWEDHLAKIASAYNSTVHKTTGFSPYFLMFGRETRLLIDMIFGIQKRSRTEVTGQPEICERLGKCHEPSI